MSFLFIQCFLWFLKNFVFYRAIRGSLQRRQHTSDFRLIRLDTSTQLHLHPSPHEVLPVLPDLVIHIPRDVVREEPQRLLVGDQPHRVEQILLLPPPSKIREPARGSPTAPRRTDPCRTSPTRCRASPPPPDCSTIVFSKKGNINLQIPKSGI